MKNQSGITMIELVIVLIIIILIATFSIYTGKESIDQATATEVYNEMRSVREAINGVNLKKDVNESYIIEEGKEYDIKVSELARSVSEFETAYGIDIEDSEFENLYIIFGLDEIEEYKKSKVKDNYDFDSIKHSYIVNFEKTEVDLLKTIELGNRNVRTFEQVRSLIGD